jgi:predicted RecA/RadA family phage recombinase
MCALSADASRIFEIGPINTLPCAASALIYKGAALGDNSGYVRALTAGDPFRGFADAKVDNSTGDAGDKSVDVITEGLQQVTITSIAITDVGKPVYMSDDDTFTLTETSNSLVGYVYRYVTTNTCVIKFGIKAQLGALECATTAASLLGYGFTTAAQAASIVAAVNALVVWANGK